ncbi:MAG: phenylalanine--tRNA ligase subunit beta [Candidatus Spechtbacterales bacterium]
MKFSYNLIQKFVSGDLPEPNKLAELLTMHSFEVEDIKKVSGDYILDIDILPNRAHDSSSHIGVAREAAAVSGLKVKTEPVQLPVADPAKAGDIKVKTTGDFLCDRYMAAVIKGVAIKDSPKWLKELLESLGLNSINNVVDAANYAMLVTGQPMHAFDMDKIKGAQINVRLAQKGETIQSLDGNGYILDDSMLVIADEKSPLAIAGIKGGKEAEVHSGTKNIILEAAHFDPVAIRNTSKKLGLATDASWRFERNIPKTLVSEGMHFLIKTIQEVAQGSVEGKIADTYSGNLENKVLAVDIKRANSILGLNITKEKISSLLKSVEFGVEDAQDQLKIKVPPFRLDIEREEDIVEEIGRLFGYENIEPKMPVAALYMPERNVNTYWIAQIKNMLSAGGFNEVYNYSFISGDSVKNWRFEPKHLWELENPPGEDLRNMRPKLSPGMLKNIKDNLKFFNTVRIFEVGEVFSKNITDNEHSHVGLAIGSKSSSERLFFELKGSVEHLLNGLGLSDIWLDDSLRPEEKAELDFMHPARVAQVKIGDSLLGFLGQVHPAVASAENLKGSAFVCELNLEDLIREAEEEEIYSPVSNYPQSVRDISVIVPKYTKASAVISVIQAEGEELLRDIDMFDYYEEAQNADSVSMAFHLIFQAKDRTLKSQEVDNLTARIERQIKNKDWEVK